MVYMKFDTAVLSIEVGPAGMGQTWDFSGVDFGHPSVIVDTLMFIDPVGTPFYPSYMSADYSDANLCMLRRTDEFFPENNDYNYYFADDDSLAFLGHWADTGGNELWEDQYPDPRRDLVFPLSYSDTYTDVFQRSFFDMSGSDYHSIVGTHTVTADGSGTLITPDGDVLDDVLRLYEVTEFVDSSMFGLENYTVVHYKWYSASRKGAVITLDMYPDDPGTVSVAHYQRQTNVITSIGENLGAKEPLRIHPVPAQDFVTAKWTGDETLRSLSLLDAAGREVKDFEYTMDRIVIQRGSLDAGTYILRAMNASGRPVHARVIFQ